MTHGMNDTLKDFAIRTAVARNQKYTNAAHALYALCTLDSTVGDLLARHRVDEETLTALMDALSNSPLAPDGLAVLTPGVRRILNHAGDSIEILRRLQQNKTIRVALADHGIILPEVQPTSTQVDAATRSLCKTGVIAPAFVTNAGLRARIRLALESALNVGE